MKENFDQILADSKIKQNGFALNEKIWRKLYLSEWASEKIYKIYKFINPPRSLFT